MDQNRYEREKKYQLTMYFFRQMQNQGIISEKQFWEMDEKMKEKYDPIFYLL